MKIIDEQQISGVVEQAKQSPRLRMNYNFHESLQDKCHRFLNALEPGTFIPVHHHHWHTLRKDAFPTGKAGPVTIWKRISIVYE